jgi:hypothetical protein
MVSPIGNAIVAMFGTRLRRGGAALNASLSTISRSASNMRAVAAPTPSSSIGTKGSTKWWANWWPRHAKAPDFFTCVQFDGAIFGKLPFPPYFSTSESLEGKEWCI